MHRHATHSTRAAGRLYAPVSTPGGRMFCAVMGMLLLYFAAMLALPGHVGLGVRDAVAASAYSPRNSGMDPPDSPKQIEALPGKSAGRTAEGGMGYTDAYGNTVENRPPEEKAAPKRIGSGAYGAREKSYNERPLPDPKNQTPAWSFK